MFRSYRVQEGLAVWVLKKVLGPGSLLCRVYSIGVWVQR